MGCYFQNPQREQCTQCILCELKIILLFSLARWNIGWYKDILKGELSLKISQAWPNVLFHQLTCKLMFIQRMKILFHLKFAWFLIILIIVLEKKNNFQRIFIRLWFEPCQFDCFPHHHRYIEVNVRCEYNGVFNNNNVCYWLMHRDIRYVSVYILFIIRV